MSINRHDDRCPECGYSNPVRQGTFEGGFGGMRGADTALLMCGDTACRFVWDTEMEFPGSPHWASGSHDPKAQPGAPETSATATTSTTEGTGSLRSSMQTSPPPRPGSSTGRAALS